MERRNGDWDSATAARVAPADSRSLSLRGVKRVQGGLPGPVRSDNIHLHPLLTDKYLCIMLNSVRIHTITRTHTGKHEQREATTANSVNTSCMLANR